MVFELFILDHLLVSTANSKSKSNSAPVFIPGLERPPVRGVGRT